MIVELVTFRTPPGMDRDAILEDAKSTIPRWSANRDLLRKHYLLSEDGQTGAGFYIWPSREAAEQGHDAAWRAAVEKRTGAPPVIRYFDLLMLLDNETGRITEWDAAGTPKPVAPPSSVAAE
ncbi:MAG: monooxygenase [Pseudorhodoplanes sp.]|nr:monooxygenase [Pseudorhodoplanes sp.]